MQQGAPMLCIGVLGFNPLIR